LLSIRSVDDGLRVGKGDSIIRLRNDAEFKNWLDARKGLDSVSAYSAARKAMTEVSDARVVLGGKMGLLNNPGDTYHGAMPGIIEEAIFALEAGMPCVPLGAFGGAARDVAIALDLLDPSKRVPRGEQSPTYDSSLRRVAAFHGSIPGALRPALIALADDDRGEPMAYEVAHSLEQWLSLKTSAHA